MTAITAPPRVVLLEDDPSLRRFAELALEEMAIELVPCVRAAEALDAFMNGPVSLLLSDLMLMGESSLPLIERLAGDAVLRGAARIVVLSAGLSPETNRQLQALGVWRVLAKPIGLKELEACVAQALEVASAPPSGAGQPMPTGGLMDDVDEAGAIAHHFAGDAALYHAFRQSCLEQFRHDAQAADEAASGADAPALRRVGHNLKTVLGSLGHAAMSRLAAEIENAAASGDVQAATLLWRRLRPALLGLAAPAP